MAASKNSMRKGESNEKRLNNLVYGAPVRRDESCSSMAKGVRAVVA
jgi:hypothetical protein